jgi:hypothetical protein
MMDQDGQVWLFTRSQASLGLHLLLVLFPLCFLSSVFSFSFSFCSFCFSFCFFLSFLVFLSCTLQLIYENVTRCLLSIAPEVDDIK